MVWRQRVNPPLCLNKRRRMGLLLDQLCSVEIEARMHMTGTSVASRMRLAAHHNATGSSRFQLRQTGRTQPPVVLPRFEPGPHVTRWRNLTSTAVDRCSAESHAHELWTWTPGPSTCLLRPARQPAQHFLCKAPQRSMYLRTVRTARSIPVSLRINCWASGKEMAMTVRPLHEGSKVMP
jgi:hypothetical protein